MKRVIAFSTLLVYQLNNSFILSEAFQISRTRPQASSGWQNGIDVFGIHTSLCGSSEYECGVFNALDGAPNCSCTCPAEKSTFTSFESKWSCIENNDVRSNLQSQQYSKPGEKACEQEMETLFVNEFSNTSSLRVLKAGDEKAISISSTWSNCELDRNHSWYFGCSDSRLSSSIYLETMMNLFTLTKGDFYFNLKVGSNALNAHLLRGRIINLGIYCRNKSTTQTQQGCLLFKLGGNITCPIPNTGMSTQQPDIYTKIAETDSTTPASFAWHVQNGTKPIHPSVTPPPIISVAHIPSSRPSVGPKSDGSGRSSRDASSIDMSVWLVSGVIVSSLFIVIIIGFLVLRRNSRRKSKAVTVTRGQATQDSALVNQHTNVAFQTDEQHGYFTLNSREPAIYASMYQVPIDRRTSFNEISNPLEQDPNTGHIYDVVNFPPENSLYEAENSTELPTLPPKSSAVDNTTKFQNYGQISIEQLVYSIVEEILASGSGNERPVGNGSKQTEPVYNVLEPEPQRDASKGTNQYEEVIVEKEEPRQDNSEGHNQHDEVTGKEPEPFRDTSGESSQFEEVAIKKSKPSLETPGEPIQNDDVTADGPVYRTLEEPS